jgi:high-affinity iron transporter
MLATLVIGLREGLEASLIVGIIAAFLRRTGKPLRPMWIGVAIAVALSIAVGVTLQLVSASLPQAAQEGMESVIGLVAVAIVTGMIGWMNVHARIMKSELERQAAGALRDGTAWALVGMAFLAVLKEGFETSVFLLAAFQSSTSVAAASAGAVSGVAIAVAIGIGIFRGGVRLNLGRFFRITGIFLVFVAAGLVLTSLRTAHEAGWINIGQQRVVDLSWLAPAGSVQAALFTGVLGIPADPRLIEVIGWLAYLIPMFAYLLWPAKSRPSGRSLAVFRVSVAAGLVLGGAVLAASVALPSYRPSDSVATVASDGSTGTATLTSSDTHRLASAPTVSHDGVRTQLLTTHALGALNHQPTMLTLTDLVAMNGGRLPIGMSATDDPGPFSVNWTNDATTKLWIYGSGLVDATSSSTTVATLTGGGLASSRTLTPASAQPPDWRMAPSARAAAVDGIAEATNAQTELLLWKFWIPIVLLIAALALCGFVLRAVPRPAPPALPASASRNPEENYA